MRKNKKNHESSSPEPYEDMIKLEILDPYEALIKPNIFLKENNKSNY